MVVEPAVIVVVSGALSAGVAWGISKSTGERNAKDVAALQQEMAEAKTLAAELKVVLVGMTGNNGLLSMMKELKEAVNEKNSVISELRHQVAVLMERRRDSRGSDSN